MLAFQLLYLARWWLKRSVPWGPGTTCVDAHLIPQGGDQVIPQALAVF